MKSHNSNHQTHIQIKRINHKKSNKNYNLKIIKYTTYYQPSVIIVINIGFLNILI